MSSRFLAPHQTQAAVAALHAQAPTPGQTDWPQIVGLYLALWSSNSSPVVELNLAAAVAMAYGPEQGLLILDQPRLAAALSYYRWFHTTRADLLARVGRAAEASAAYVQALVLAEQAMERMFLHQRAAELPGGDGGAVTAAPHHLQQRAKRLSHLCRARQHGCRTPKAQSF